MKTTYTAESVVGISRSKFICASPRKVGLVAGLIRGLPVQQAMLRLAMCKKAVSIEVAKLLKSAVANAVNGNGADVDSLIVHQVLVGKAIAMRRLHARAKGRGSSIIKRYSNMTIELVR